MSLSRRALLATTPLLLAARPVPAADPVATAPAVAASATAAAGPVRLIANENPYGASERALEAVRAALAEAWQYPVGREATLKRLIAEREGVAPEQVMIGDGSGEILRVAALAWARTGGGVVAARPTFDFLPSYARLLGAPVTEVPLDAAMRHDLPAMAAAVSASTALVYVCNPNNPTGTLVPGREIRPFVSEVSRRAPVLVDEAYLDLWDDAGEHTCADRVRAGEPVIVTRTFSKLHGLAGLRIGYAIAPVEIIRRLQPLRMSLLNTAGIAAATASYQDLDYQALSRRRLKEALAVTRAALADVGWPATDTRGNFVFFDTGRPVGEFAAAMRAEGFLVGRPFAPYETWCRVSIGTLPQMKGFAAALRRYAARRAEAAA
ncbi:MAG: aminotransferase class I/II-fold pyridoxal phosphate-dependent enzyme [Chromatiales bacterium]|jgi:histidinol-phosphate aminotransferase|nr:aminotransferase class I/II-fold pyridoxal phosphate-dependent enzyme [Chromatiales bacterium]